MLPLRMKSARRRPGYADLELYLAAFDNGKPRRAGDPLGNSKGLRPARTSPNTLRRQARART
jgi:hypothetical protein